MLGKAILSVAGTALVVAGCSAPPPPPPPAPPTVHTPVPGEVEPAGCLGTGVTVKSGPVEVALGHRAVVLTLTNCGTTPRTLTGYPEVRLLDKKKQPMAVEVEHGTSYMAIDPGVSPQTVQPGGTLLSVVSWSNTVTAGSPEAGAYVTVAAATGDPEQRITVDTDLGTTGKLTLTAWNAALKH
ncbi:DUF4232 domain-containing protein [Amycolatopsis azurea]|uniref:DUF4232 domain-containing protein n=1 Tax=Amycolatopsis azurea DSM 43854 TaxID=1238180 RepID=M2QCR5_9PSEU|nr:DUF4232 domain-containing protein [Amycolatopsis azurea]EMD24526.1 hypothetical protein C791_5546 [Amycolatopsis azurea DSM 43854]